MVFSGTPVSSTNKTDRHDVAEILLKVALNPPTHLKGDAAKQKMMETREILPMLMSQGMRSGGRARQRLEFYLNHKLCQKSSDFRVLACTSLRKILTYTRVYATKPYKTPELHI